MKLRQGFVSNSSTTSFTCDACGEVIAYSDSCSDGDVGITRFECGHATCTCSEPDLSKEEVRNVWLSGARQVAEVTLSDWKDTKPSKYLSQEKIDKEVSKYEDALKLSEFDDFRDALIRISYEWRSFNPEELCPVCSLQSINNDYIFDYVVAKFKLNLAEVHDEIKSKFKNFAEFKEWVQSQKETIK